RRWAVLLSPDGDRSFQPRPVGVSGTPVGEDGAHATRVPSALPGGGLAPRDPHRQWRPVRLDRDPWPLAPQRLVDAARHRPSADYPAPSPRTRPPSNKP